MEQDCEGTLTFTTTLPVVAPDGTETVTLLLPQALAVAARPLNVTVLNLAGFQIHFPKWLSAIRSHRRFVRAPKLQGWEAL